MFNRLYGACQGTIVPYAANPGQGEVRHELARLQRMAQALYAFGQNALQAGQGLVGLDANPKYARATGWAEDVHAPGLQFEG